MNASELWRLFLDTGAPEVYLMYNQARKLEASHVPDDTGTCAACYGLQ